MLQLLTNVNQNFGQQVCLMFKEDFIAAEVLTESDEVIQDTSIVTPSTSHRIDSMTSISSTAIDSMSWISSAAIYSISSTAIDPMPFATMMPTSSAGILN